MAPLSEIAPRLAVAGRALHARGWALGTSGNFSAVVRREPLRPRDQPQRRRQGPPVRGGHPGGRRPSGLPLDGDGRPSDETVVHLAVVRERGAGAVLHTHSVWSTLLSEAAGDAGGLALVRLRDAEGPRGRRDPRAPRVGADRREHPGLRPDGARREGRARAATPARTACCCAATASTPGAATSRRRSATSRSLEFLFEVEGRLSRPRGG